MSSSVNNQAPPPPSPAAGADVPRTPDTVATVSDSLSLTNSILIVLIGYLLWKMFGKRIGQSKSTLMWFCFVVAVLFLPVSMSALFVLSCFYRSKLSPIKC